MRLPTAILTVLAVGGCGGSRVGAGADGPIAPHELPHGPAARASYAPWPSFGHDSRHSGAAPAVGPQRPVVRWRRRLEGAVVPGPVVGRKSTVYAASNGGVLHAIDLQTGADRWRFDGGGSYGSDLSTAPAVLRDGTILWPGPRETLYALSPRGRLLRRERLPGQPLSPVVVGRGLVAVGDTSGTLELLAVRGHRPSRRRWRVDLGAISYGSPAVRGRTIYTTVDRALVAVRGGRVRWRRQVQDTIEVSPAVAADGTVVFGGNDDTEYGVGPDGTLRWRHAIGALTYSSPAVTRDGLVYFGDHHGFMNVLRVSDGRLVSRVLGLGRTARRRSVGVWTAPVVDARHDVYFGTRPGHIYGFDARGRRLLDIDTGATVDSYPALAADGTLLVGSESGVLYAIRD
jgi:outer membrane protein assembly factor BamB